MKSTVYILNGIKSTIIFSISKYNKSITVNNLDKMVDQITIPSESIINLHIILNVAGDRPFVKYNYMMSIFAYLR